MYLEPSPLSAKLWIRNVFASKTAMDGGVVRRKSSDVARIVGRERFLDEIERRGFRALENSGQIIVICNTDPIRMLR